MIHMACVRYWADFLTADMGGGVMRINQELAAVPRFPADDAPPDILLVAHPYAPNDIRSQRVAQNQAPQQTPALYIEGEGPIPTEGEVSPGGAPRDCIPVMTTKYLVLKSDFPQAQQWAAYTMKALERCAFKFFADDEVGQTARGYSHESGIAIINCGYADNQYSPTYRVGIAYGAWTEDIGMAMTAQVFTLVMTVRDLNP